MRYTVRGCEEPTRCGQVVNRGNVAVSVAIRVLGTSPFAHIQTSLRSGGEGQRFLDLLTSPSSPRLLSRPLETLRLTSPPFRNDQPTAPSSTLPPFFFPPSSPSSNLPPRRRTSVPIRPHSRSPPPASTASLSYATVTPSTYKICSAAHSRKRRPASSSMVDGERQGVVYQPRRRGGQAR